MENRWTVRGVDPDAVELVRVVRETCGLPTGTLLSDAIRVWFEHLPEIDDQDEYPSYPDSLSRLPGRKVP